MIRTLNPQTTPPGLTVQILCRGEAAGLDDTLTSLTACHRPDRLHLEVQVLPWQLQPGGLERLTSHCAQDSSLIWWGRSRSGHTSALEAAARQQTSQAARGAWIWWLEAGDLLQPEALVQWAEAAAVHPEALLVAGDGEQLNDQGEVIRRHGALPSSTRLRQLVQEQLYCPGAVCVQQRLLRQVPLPLSTRLSGSHREAWLLDVLEHCRDRIVVVPQCWVQTPALVDGPASGRCRQRALELSEHLAQRWGEAPAGLLHRYGLQLQQGEAALPQGSTAIGELESALETARPWLGEEAWKRLRLGWGLNPQAAPWQQQLESALGQGNLEQLWCVTLLRNLLHPELGALHLGSPWGPNLRLAERLLSADLWCQYRLLRQDAELLALLNQPLEGIPLIGLLHWQGEPNLQRQFPLPEALEEYGHWWCGHAGNAIPHGRFNGTGQIEPEPYSEEPLLHPEQRPFGVNLIGHAFEVFGIGEDVRMAALALESAEVPFCVVNVPANNGAAASDRSLEARTLPPGELGPYRFNLVCLAAPSHGAWIAREGLAQQCSRTTIVAWPWETQTWPQAWECMIPLADSLWPSSTFTAKALEPFSDPLQKPLQVMPMAVHIEQPERYREAGRRRHTRERWGLDPEAKLVLLVFDVKSSLERKNPWGALEAFQQAFPKGSSDNVQLVIKALTTPSPNAEWEKLKQQAAKDQRLRVIASDLSRHDLLALMGACDVFLSLHRSEGFGRGIAEAGLLGLEVVASAFGGNVDFCRGNSYHMIPCKPSPINPGTYAGAANHWWGEPDQGAACQQLIQATRSQSRSKISQETRQNLSREQTGYRYRAGLKALALASARGY